MKVAEIQHLTSMDFELIAVKLMIGIRNCPHGRLLPYLEMRILETERYRHWKRFCYYVQTKVKRIILGDILFQAVFIMGCLSDRSVLRDCGSIAVCLVSGIIDYMKEYKIKSKMYILVLEIKKKNSKSCYGKSRRLYQRRA